MFEGKYRFKHVYRGKGKEYIIIGSCSLSRPFVKLTDLAGPVAATTVAIAA